MCFFVEVPAPRGFFGGGGPSATAFTSVASKRRTGERRAVDVDVRDFGERERLRSSPTPSVLARLRRADTIKTEIKKKIEHEITHENKHSKVTIITKQKTTPSNKTENNTVKFVVRIIVIVVVVVVVVVVIVVVVVVVVVAVIVVVVVFVCWVTL